jgi:peptidoglycan/LPS O-acetylase OafA/YrhL
MQEETVVFWLFTFVIAGGVFVIVNALKYRAKILEMAHRERLAMIERGLKPAGPLLDVRSTRPAQLRSSRMMSGGIVAVGFGLALAVVIGFTSREPDIAVGIGGAVAILGAAFIVTAYVKHQGPKEPEAEWRPRSFDSSAPLPPEPPPTNER